MILLDTEALLRLFHQTEGFPAPIRDLGALESAVHRQNAAVFGNVLYPTLDLKVAALMDGIARSHPLVDGSKRLTMLAAVATFYSNGRPHWRGSADELVDFILQISDGHLEVPAIAERLAEIFTAERAQTR